MVPTTLVLETAVAGITQTVVRVVVGYGEEGGRWHYLRAGPSEGQDS